MNTFRNTQLQIVSLNGTDVNPDLAMTIFRNLALKYDSRDLISLVIRDGKAVVRLSGPARNAVIAFVERMQQAGYTAEFGGNVAHVEQLKNNLLSLEKTAESLLEEAAHVQGAYQDLRRSYDELSSLYEARSGELAEARRSAEALKAKASALEKIVKGLRLSYTANPATLSEVLDANKRAVEAEEENASYGAIASALEIAALNIENARFQRRNGIRRSSYFPITLEQTAYGASIVIPIRPEPESAVARQMRESALDEFARMSKHGMEAAKKEDAYLAFDIRSNKGFEHILEAAKYAINSSIGKIAARAGITPYIVTIKNDYNRAGYVAERMEALGYKSVADFQERTGFPESNLSRILSGHEPLGNKSKVLGRLARALGVSVEEMMAYRSRK